MKKIISLIATAALALGFVSCSGDLHDDVKKPIDLSGGYYLVGSMTGSWSNKAADVVAFESNGDGTYKVPFSADAAEIAFAFIPKADSWDGQIGGDKMTAGTLPSGAKFESKDNGNGGKNGTISGLEANGKYKLVVTPLDNGTLKIDCSSNVPPTPTYLQNMYVRGGMIDSGWAVTLAGSLLYDRLDEAKGEVYYHVDFKNATVANNQYSIANSDWSPKYTAAKVTVGGDYVKTTKNSDFNNEITGIVAGRAYRIYVKTTPAGDVYTKVAEIAELNITVKGCKVLNYKSENEIYVLEGWVPDNDWSAKSPNHAKPDATGTTVVDFSKGYSYSFLGEVADLNAAVLHIQIVDCADSNNFWNKKVTAGADASVKSCESDKTYYLVYDAEEEKASLVAAE